MSAAPKWTPGPWTAEDPMGKDAGDDLWIVEATKPSHEWRTLALVCSDEPGEDFEPIGIVERDANAALIAAAPDLYAALVEARAALPSTCASEREAEDGLALLAEIDAALAKARGEQVAQ